MSLSKLEIIELTKKELGLSHKKAILFLKDLQAEFDNPKAWFFNTDMFTIKRVIHKHYRKSWKF